MLLTAGRTEDACAHLDVLIQALPQMHWVLNLGVEAATAAGDHLMAARYRRQLRDVSAESGLEWETSSHPSHTQDEARVPHLRLVSGGGSDAPTIRTARRTLNDIAGLAT